MVLSYAIPDEVIHYNRVFEEWNKLVSSVRYETRHDAIIMVSQWWGSYARDYDSKKMTEKYNVPRNVWKILEQVKINHIEKVYGIYYTLRYIFEEDSQLRISTIQFEDSGQIDVAVIVDSVIVCDGLYSIRDTTYDELSIWENDLVH